MNTTRKRKRGGRATESPRRLLVPVDYSEASRKALIAGVALARHFGAQLTVTHVTRLKRPDSHPPLELLGAVPDGSRAELARLKSFVAHEAPGDMKISTRVTDGVPFDQIVRLAKSSKADWIVIATHGYTGLKHILLGSTAERVIQRAPCPVIVVRGQDRRGVQSAFSPASICTLILTTDLSENSLAAFPHAVAWARETGARLLLLYVVPEHLPAELSHIGLVLQEKRLARQAAEQLPEFARSHLPVDLAVETRVLIGPPEHTICETAKSLGADLIVMSSHGYTGFKHLMLGSVAERVVQRSPCTVMVIRPKVLQLRFPR